MSIQVRIKRLTETAVIPTGAYEQAAGHDLYADIKDPVVILPGGGARIGTGLSFEIPEGYFGGVFARSGLATKEGLRLANSVAVIDSDYRGEVSVFLRNDSDVKRVIHPGERIAQLVIIPHLVFSFVEADELLESERGEKGFGSSGK